MTPKGRNWFENLGDRLACFALVIAEAFGCLYLLELLKDMPWPR